MLAFKESSSELMSHQHAENNPIDPLHRTKHVKRNNSLWRFRQQCNVLQYVLGQVQKDNTLGDRGCSSFYVGRGSQNE